MWLLERFSRKTIPIRKCTSIRASILAAAAIAHWSCGSAYAQGAAPVVPLAPSQAQQVPLSGRQGQPGSVETTQTPVEAAGQGALTLESTVNVQGAYTGSVASGRNTGTMLPLGLDYALRLALQQNLGAITESNAERQAEGQRLSTRSGLLPQVNTLVSETVEQINLRTFGIALPGVPEAVGPFNFFDVRAARVEQAVFDLTRLRNLRTATQNREAVMLAARDARDLIVLAVAGSYLEIIASNARITAADAQVRSSQAIYQQAIDRLKAGLNARIDTTRTEVQLQIDRQRLRSLEAERDRQKLRLGRIIGLPLGQEFSIADDFPFTPLTSITMADALARAYRTRADLQSAEAAVRAADSAVKAAHAERYPTVTVMGDYGAAGLRPTNSAHGTFTVTGTLNIPLYQGGRVHGDVEQAEAALRQRQAEVEDVRGRIDQDVRQSFIDLNAAADQVDVARSNVDLAEDTLRQARDRFAAGVTDTVEVVQAQQSVVAAHDDYIVAVFDHNLAKVSLARAMGEAERTVQQFLPKK